MPSWRRTDLPPGVYDEPVTARLAAALTRLGHAAQLREMSKHDAAGAALEAFVAEAVGIALREVRDRPEAARALVNELLSVLQRHAPQAFSRPGELQLEALWLDAIAEGTATAPARPLGSLVASRLLVNAVDESLLDHLRSEFDSADRVDLLCAFVKLSGFEKLRGPLERHCSARGRHLRLLTTTYMGASDAAAIERFAALPNCEVKVSYDEHSTRLHAKAWHFHRANGYSTVFIGSSNLSHAAQTDGLEWNVRLTEQGEPAVVAQVAETFEQYWQDPYQFEAYRQDSPPHRARLRSALSTDGRSQSGIFVPMEVTAKDYQRPVLEELASFRRLGRHRNLLVAATGTGKTVMAALDYARLRRREPAEPGQAPIDTLLFVAHRREILEQSRAVFRNVLQERSFGELLVAGERPSVGRHVFASVDSLAESGSAVAAGFDVAAFDMVIVDEAHHTPARTWSELLDRLQPSELLGLTATPERADGQDPERHFPRPWIDNLRVWHAIPNALVPFRYYMLDVEGVDLREVTWSAGRYASGELAGKLIGAAEIFVQRAVRAVAECVARPEEMRAIAFCADVAHAYAVQRHLQASGLRASVLTAATATALRRDARAALDSGDTQVLCVVDLYNEGVDVPNVNTLFFFRPTESATVFLQQLGRGLRRAPGKAELVVFDLTARQHHQFRFDRKLRAPLGMTHRELGDFVRHGFGRLPAGCFLHFDERARQEILDQIRRAIPSTWRELAALLSDPAHSPLSLEGFLQATDVDLRDIYAPKRSWTALRQAAHLDRQQLGAEEKAALHNVHKLCHVGDELRLSTWERLVAGQPLQSPAAQRARDMLFAVLYGKAAAAVGAAVDLWRQHPALRAEIAALVPVLRRENALLSPPDRLHQDIPLVLHARYLGVELSAAFGQRTASGDFRDYYTGVEATGDGRFDLLLVTLEKAAATKEHLRYRDFPLTDRQFHWQSKAATTLDSRQGQRHVRPGAVGVTPLLLVRERAKDGGQTVAFRYLGPVTPLSHEGERPISIRWSLRYPMPAALLVAGRVAS